MDFSRGMSCNPIILIQIPTICLYSTKFSDHQTFFRQNSDNKVKFSPKFRQVSDGHIQWVTPFGNATVENLLIFFRYHTLTSLFYNSMTLIPFDRLLCVLAPHKYMVYVRRPTIRKVAKSPLGFSDLSLLHYT